MTVSIIGLFLFCFLSSKSNWMVFLSFAKMCCKMTEMGCPARRHWSQSNSISRPGLLHQHLDAWQQSCYIKFSCNTCSSLKTIFICPYKIHYISTKNMQTKQHSTSSTVTIICKISNQFKCVHVLSPFDEKLLIKAESDSWFSF